MKVALFSEVYAPVLSGPAQMLVALKRALEARGVGVYVFTTGRSTTEHNVFRSPRISLSQGYGISIPFYKEQKLLKDVDVIHTHHPFILGMYALYQARRYKKPLIFTFHCQYGEYTEIYVPLIGRFLRRAIERYVGWYGNHCDAVILPSEELRPVVTGAYGMHEERIHVIPNGITLAPIDRSAVARLSSLYNLTDKRVIAYAGRLAKEKDIEIVVRMFARLSPEMQACSRLLLVGGGPDSERLQAIAREEGIADHLICTGYVPNIELLQHLALAEIFVSASSSEVHPLTLLEAMYAGTVPVVLRAPGFSDGIKSGTNGLLVAEKNAAAFASAIENLLKNRDILLSMKAENEKNIRQYDIAATARALDDVYMSALALKG